MRNRIDQLNEFIKEEPENPFLIYALALEYLKTEPTQAKIYFDQLLKYHPSYLPTYYHAAQFYLEIDQRSRARQIYEVGIALTRKTEDHHALKELQNAYTNFLLDD
ncbi:MAG: tetratricopeptide repeat protein [Bacteroidetes bacterium]|nr:tetratricopeptide repeat protein [Bacteroidota bacterium]MDA1121375.1 tetratricopeptide repeat protein [Bacteroidota bacterium]